MDVRSMDVDWKTDVAAPFVAAPRRNTWARMYPPSGAAWFQEIPKAFRRWRLAPPCRLRSAHHFVAAGIRYNALLEVALPKEADGPVGDEAGSMPSMTRQRHLPFAKQRGTSTSFPRNSTVNWPNHRRQDCPRNSPRRGTPGNCPEYQNWGCRPCRSSALSRCRCHAFGALPCGLGLAVLALSYDPENAARLLPVANSVSSCSWRIRRSLAGSRKKHTYPGHLHALLPC